MIPLVKNDVTLSFCQVFRDDRSTMAIFVSNTFGCSTVNLISPLGSLFISSNRMILIEVYFILKLIELIFTHSRLYLLLLS